MLEQVVSYVENWTDSTVKKLEQSMRPGQSSQVGFLSENDSLVETIMKDYEALDKNGVSYDILADCLELYSKRGERSNDLDDKPLPNLSAYTPRRYSYRVDDSIFFEPDLVQTMGFQECPFHPIGCDYRDKGMMFSLKNEKTGESVRLNTLLVHMIRNHYFFEGCDTPYRLDPEKTIRVLDLKNKKHDDIKASLTPIRLMVWNSARESSYVDNDEILFLNHYCLAKDTTIDGVTIYLATDDSEYPHKKWGYQSPSYEEYVKFCETYKIKTSQGKKRTHSEYEFYKLVDRYSTKIPDVHEATMNLKLELDDQSVDQSTSSNEYANRLQDRKKYLENGDIGSTLRLVVIRNDNSERDITITNAFGYTISKTGTYRFSRWTKIEKFTLDPFEYVLAYMEK